MNINKLDQFYTNEKIAEKCIELFYKFVNVENYNYILEQVPVPVHFIIN